MRYWMMIFGMCAVTVWAYTGCVADVEGPPTEVVADSEALTTYIYTYINSNDNAPLAALGQGDIKLRGLRAFAMSKHAENSHNYWSCHASQGNVATHACTHSPAATGGSKLLYSICLGAPHQQCDLYISYSNTSVFDIPWSQMQTEKVGYFTWLSGPDTYYTFNDGADGQGHINQDTYSVNVYN